MTVIELQDLKERFGSDDPLGARLLQGYLDLRNYVIEQAQYLDSPGPSPEKTAGYYAMAARTRQLAASFQAKN